MTCKYCNSTEYGAGPCQTLDDAICVCQNYYDIMLTKISIAQVASCGCFTKSPNIEAHNPECLYRVLEEARIKIEYIEDRYLDDVYEARFND